MLALHSFLYDQAHVGFAAALAADPKCAMAAWGDAMAYDKAIWNDRDVPRGRAALARVSSEESLTPKERAFLRVARADFERPPASDAHAAWLAAAAAMHHDYPDDDEVTLQYALALLSVHGGHSAHLREQMEAGSLALQVLQHNPEHPGAAHYVIHAFDSPAHAILALPAARLYARIAPAGSHALHMPSHVFAQLGMWRDVVASNERAYAASAAWEKSRGHTPSNYDWHSYSWLVAAHLELGQPAAARKLIDEASTLLVAAKDDSAELRFAYARMVSNYATQTGRWEEVEAMIAPVFGPAVDEGGGAGTVACAAHAPGGSGATREPVVPYARLYADESRAEAAIRLGDERTAVQRVADMKTVRAQMAPWKEEFSTDLTNRFEAALDALLARAHAGLKPSAAAEKKIIAALERRQKLESGDNTSGPAMDRTLHELFGEALLGAGKPKDALAQFEKALDDRPNRALALLGAARAAKAAGDTEKARLRYGALAELWKDADANLPDLAEVKAGANERSRP
jgi:tetratricopeptide (TPR) repeat protein